MQSVANILGMVVLYLIVGGWAAFSIWKAYRVETKPPTWEEAFPHDGTINIRDL